MDEIEFKEKMENLIKKKNINPSKISLQHNLDVISKLKGQSNKKRIKMHRRKSG